MPSGYTCYIANGISFSDWAMLCARAMGATITMRDDPIDAPIPKFKPSTYHEEKISRITLQLAEARARSDEEWAAAREAAEQKRLDDNRKRSEEKLALKAKYEEMAEKVVRWKPPTSEHVGLRDFMLKQIQESIKWDCETYEEPPLPENYKEAEICSLLERLAYHSKHDAEERTRTEQRNKWVQQLRESLP